MTRPGHRRQIVNLLAGLIVATLLVPSGAWAFAEWYVAGSVGGAFPQNTDVVFTSVQASSDGSTLVARDFNSRNVSLDASLQAGAKAGACPRVVPFLCAEIEFDYFAPGLDRQSAGSSSPPVSRFDFTVYDLGLNVIGRVALLADPAYPLGGRLHLYAGAGPTFVWTKAENEDCVGAGSMALTLQTEGGLLVRPIGAMECKGSDVDFSVGVQALSGAKFFVTKHLAVFAEYKFKHWNSDFSFPTTFVPASGVSPSAVPPIDVRLRDMNFDVHLFSVGLAVHF